ncbi:MAG: transcriptional repressor LexA [Pseudomonadota bacterium]
MTPLTKRQNEFIKYLRDIQRSGEPSPTISELSRHFGFRSTRSARDHLKALERKGFIQKDANKARSIRVIESTDIEPQSVSIPLVGSIPAGYPEGRNQRVERFVHIDMDSIGFVPGESCYALRVTGDSMIGKGIYEDDIVIVDGSREPKEGDIVAALIDNESTLKTLVRKNGESFLKPENQNYPDMIPANELVLQGVVRTVIRNVC